MANYYQSDAYNTFPGIYFQTLKLCLFFIGGGGGRGGHKVR